MSKVVAVVGATGAVVFFEGNLHRVGDTPSPEAVLAILNWVNAINRPLFETNNLASQYAAGAGLTAP